MENEKPQDDRQTPEQVSADMLAESGGKPTPEKPVEETPAIPPAKEEKKPEEVQKPEEKKPEEEKPADKPEDKKQEDNLPTKPRTIYETLKDKKEIIRENKVTIETLQTQLADKETEIADLKKLSEKAETPAEKKEVDDEIKALAEEIGANPEGIAKLTEFLKKTVKSAEAPAVALSPEDQKALDQVKHENTLKEVKAQFQEEFKAFEPSLKQQFPTIKAEDMTSVMSELDRLAHTEAYKIYPLDYIFFKEKANLEKLISPQKPSYEGVDHKPAPEGEVEVELDGRSTPEQASKSTKKSGRKSALEVHSS